MAEKKYTVQHDKANCIGCGACTAVAPDFWVMDDGKSKLVGSKEVDDDLTELDIEEKDLQANKEAAESCPINGIHIINRKTKEKII